MAVCRGDEPQLPGSCAPNIRYIMSSGNLHLGVHLCAAALHNSAVAGREVKDTTWTAQMLLPP